MRYWVGVRFPGLGDESLDDISLHEVMSVGFNEYVYELYPGWEGLPPYQAAPLLDPYSLLQEINEVEGILIEPSTDELTRFLSQHGQRVGVYFMNLETGFEFAYNPSRVFFGASINKATHALYTYIAAERGYIDMYAMHVYRASDYWGGTGIMRFNHYVGAGFTTRDLLYYSIVHSDNVAFRMLVSYMQGISFSYRDFVMEIGSNPAFIIDSVMFNATAADTGMWMYEIVRYLESESRYGHYFQQDLFNVALYSHPFFTRGEVFGGDVEINVDLLRSDYPVAQKYGWGTSAFNVMGAVYGPSPFILVMLSNISSGAHELFEEIAKLFQEFNARYFY